jgi:hypothetical protein
VKFALPGGSSGPFELLAVLALLAPWTSVQI